MILLVTFGLLLSSYTSNLLYDALVSTLITLLLELHNEHFL